MNLWQRLMVAVTVVFGVLFAVFSVLALRAVDDSTQRILRERLVIAQMAARDLDRVVQRSVHELETSRSFGRFDPKAPSLADEYHLLAHAHGGLGAVSLGVFFLDPHGRVVLTEPRPRTSAARSFVAEPYVRRVIATKRPVVSAPFRDRSGKPAVAIAVPVLNADGRLRSILVGLLDASSEDFITPLRQAMQLGRSGHGELVGPGGIVITSTEPDDVLKPGEHLPFYRTMLRSRASGAENVLYTPWDAAPGTHSHQHHVMAWAPLRGVPWGVAVGGTDTETFAPVARLRRMLFLAGSGTLGGLWLLALFGARLLVRPVRTLTRAAHEMAAGDLDRPVRVAEGGEIGVLGQSLDAMRSQLGESLETVRRWGEELEEKVEERTEELNVRNRQLAAVTAVATAANRAHDLDGILEACLAAILEHTQADGVAVRLVDERSGELGPPHAGGIYRDFPCRTRTIAANECPCGVVAARQDPLYLVGNELSAFEPSCCAPARALSVLPLRTRKGLLGVLSLAQRDHEARLPDRRTLAAIADQLAVVIENARLVDELGRIEAQHEVQRVKENLISAVSHELRTPLGFIKGYTTTILREGAALDPELQQQFLEIVDEEAGKLEQMIDELLDASRLQTGRLSIELQPVQLGPLVERAAVKMRPGLEEAGHELVVRLPEVEVSALVDPLRIEQVVNNLVENAARYSDPGTAVEVDVVAEDGYVVVAVKDHGEGIPNEEQSRIFEPFYRGTNSRRRAVRGTGLGLAICRGFVEAQGGTIWVQSEPGRGTSFFVSLPALDGDRPDLPARPAPEVSTAR